MPVVCVAKSCDVWRPILNGPRARQALDAAEAIASAVATGPCEGARQSRRSSRVFVERAAPDFSLSDGAAGLAVFLHYLSEAGVGSRHARIADRFLREAAGALASVAMPPGLFAGFTGIAWAVTHLARPARHSQNIGSTAAIDKALRTYTRRAQWRGAY